MEVAKHLSRTAAARCSPEWPWRHRPDLERGSGPSCFSRVRQRSLPRRVKLTGFGSSSARWSYRLRKTRRRFPATKRTRGGMSSGRGSRRQTIGPASRFCAKFEFFWRRKWEVEKEREMGEKIKTEVSQNKNKNISDQRKRIIFKIESKILL